MTFSEDCAIWGEKKDATGVSLMALKAFSCVSLRHSFAQIVTAADFSNVNRIITFEYGYRISLCCRPKGKKKNKPQT